MSQVSISIKQGPRENLEDIGLVLTTHAPGLTTRPACLLLVFDGVGGNAWGEEASCLALGATTSHLAQFLASTVADQERTVAPDVVLDEIVRALEAANEVILRRTRDDERYAGMATTAVCAVILDELLYVGWVGDSRCYLYRNGDVRQLTRDHSEVQRLVDAGLISDDDALYHPLAHTIHRYLGQAGAFAADTRVCRMKAGDIVLLCTDGLTDVIGDDQIAEGIDHQLTALELFDDLAAHLADRAVDAGTGDNVTVACYRHESGLHRRAPRPHDTLTMRYPDTLARALQSLVQERSR